MKEMPKWLKISLLIITIILVIFVLISVFYDNKKAECVRLCVGNDNTPYLKSECRSSCNQIYYYGGEEALDNYIKEMKNQS